MLARYAGAVGAAAVLAALAWAGAYRIGGRAVAWDYDRPDPTIRFELCTPWRCRAVPATLEAVVGTSGSTTTAAVTTYRAPMTRGEALAARVGILRVRACVGDSCSATAR